MVRLVVPVAFHRLEYIFGNISPNVCITAVLHRVMSHHDLWSLSPQVTEVIPLTFIVPGMAPCAH
jgi:hypothetical protein